MDLFLIILMGVLLAEVTYLVYKSSGRASSRGRRTVFVDTSALMDGRIVTAAQAGFIPDALVIPQSVIAELQLLADQADSEKRSRARRGLDAVRELQEVKGLQVKIMDDGRLGEGGVDARLVELARRHGGMLCTIDFNLNKVATVHDIQVLNINELAGSLRMAFLPGETISLTLNQKGQSEGQAVGYLADGTMVVVDKASAEIGKTVQVEFIRSLQTAAGRMMFARLVAKSQAAKQSPSKSKNEGRAPVKKTQHTRPAASKDQTKSEQTPEKSTSSKPKPSAGRNQRRKRTNEDSLLELVNNQ